MFKRRVGILLVLCLAVAGAPKTNADQACEGVLCGGGRANRHAVRTGMLIDLAQWGQDLFRKVTDKIYNDSFLGEDWFWGGQAEAFNRRVNEKFGDIVGEHNYIRPEEIPGLRETGAEVFNMVAMEAATAGIVAAAPLAQRGLRALRGMPMQRGSVDLGIFGQGWRQSGPNSSDAMTVVLPLHQGGKMYPPSSRAAGSWNNKGSHYVGTMKNLKKVSCDDNNSALSHGDLIRAINYTHSRHASIQLNRMIDSGKTFNYVVLARGSRRELLVAPQSGYKEGMMGLRELGTKHVQLARGKPIFMGGTMKVTRTPDGNPFVVLTNDSGTYGPRIKMDDEHEAFTKGFVQESFHYQIADTDIDFDPVVR